MITDVMYKKSRPTLNIEERPNPSSGQIYRHFKGKNYEVLTLAEDTETGRTVVVYRALYGDFKVYTRDLEMFMSLTDKSKYPEARQKFRFERLAEAEPSTSLKMKNFQSSVTHSPAEKLVKFGDSLDHFLEIIENLPEEFKDRTGFRLAVTSINNCRNCSKCHQESHMFGPGVYSCTKHKEVSNIVSLMADGKIYPCAAYTCNECDFEGSK